LATYGKSLPGEMSEWSKETDSKSVVPFDGTEGSNPSLSAFYQFLFLDFFGEMSEWSKVHPWKGCEL
jgi:hypothetical protein